MLVKFTGRNQLKLPRQAIEAWGNPSQFQVEAADAVYWARTAR
jgi:hypothetical protein